MTKHPIIIILMGLVIGSLVFWLFVALRSKDDPAEQKSEVLAPPKKTAVKQTSSPPTAPKPTKLAAETVTKPKDATPHVTNITGDPLKAGLVDALNLPSPEARQTAIQQQVVLITAENVIRFQEIWKELVVEDPNVKIYGSMVNRKLGQLNGPVIVGSRTGESPKDMNGAATFVKDQFAGWVEVDATAAEAWLMGLKNVEFREKILDAYLAGEQGQRAPKKSP